MWPGHGEHLVLMAWSPSIHLRVLGRTLLPLDGEEKGLSWRLSPGRSQDGGALISGLTCCPIGHCDAFLGPTVFLENALPACILGVRAEGRLLSFGEREEDSPRWDWGRGGCESWE